MDLQLTPNFNLEDVPRPEGTIRLWERPEDIPVDEFLAMTQDQLGPPLVEAKNTVVNNWYIDAFTTMYGGVANIAIGALSLGTGAATIARTDSAMVTEWKRYGIVAYTLTSTDPPNVLMSFFSTAADGAATITEAGLFHGGATTTLGTGRMTSHVLFSYSKPSNQDVRIDYTINRSAT